jgi:hypothetical protein
MLALKWLEPQSTITQTANMKTKARPASILMISLTDDSGKSFSSFYDMPAEPAMVFGPLAIEPSGEAL